MNSLLWPSAIKNLALLSYRWLGWLLLLAAVLFAWNNQVSRFDPTFRSPFDEFAHFDYWWQIYEKKQLPKVYDRMQQESLAIWNCYGDNVADDPSCNPKGPGDSERENTASNYPPTFYVATAGMAWLIDQFIETDNLFHLAKLANLAWGLICVILVAWLALALHVPLILSAVLVFAIGQTPAFVFAGITLNQEMFVLLFCLIGLLWYVQRTVHTNAARFIFETGLLAGICLSIKPTALLLPVVIAIAELLASPRPWRARMTRVIGFTLAVGAVYLLLTAGVNQWRGINPSDGKMRDYLLSFGHSRDWMEWTIGIWTAFERSTSAWAWRSLVDWQLPWLFTRFYLLVVLMFALSIPYVLYLEIKSEGATVASRLMVGAALAFVVLPVALAIYLQFGDFPFFFQSRYYTAYIVVATIVATAFLADLLKWGGKAATTAWRCRTSTGRCHVT